MKRNLEEITAQNRFEMDLGNQQVAHINYRKEDDHYHLLHSEVPEQLRGRGIGKELVEKTFEKIYKNGNKATAHCRYIKAVAKRSEKWNKIVNY